MSKWSLEEWRRNRPPQPSEMSPERLAEYRAKRGLEHNNLYPEHSHKYYNRPLLNQVGTFMHGGGTWEDWDYDIPDDVDFDAQVSRDDLMESDTGWGPLTQAAQGRFGDSMMRNVGGEPAHVNPMEAEIIDNYGQAGQRAVQAVGAGTRNPNTGKKEYFIPAMMAAGAVVSGLGGMYAAHQAGKGARLARKQQKRQLANIEGYEQMGEEFMDPNSARNQMYLQNIQQQGLNQVALQNQMAQRNAAAYGGGFSGAQAQQAQQARLQAGLQGRQQWLGQMGQQQQTGLGILGKALQMEGDVRDNLGNLRMAQSAAQGQMVSGAMSGIGQGMMGYQTALAGAPQPQIPYAPGTK